MQVRARLDYFYVEDVHTYSLNGLKLPFNTPWSKTETNTYQKYIVHDFDERVSTHWAQVSTSWEDESVSFDTYKEAKAVTDDDFSYTWGDIGHSFVEGLGYVGEEATMQITGPKSGKMRWHHITPQGLIKSK